MKTVKQLQLSGLLVLKLGYVYCVIAIADCYCVQEARTVPMAGIVPRTETDTLRDSLRLAITSDCQIFSARAENCYGRKFGNHSLISVKEPAHYCAGGRYLCLGISVLCLTNSDCFAVSVSRLG